MGQHGRYDEKHKLWQAQCGRMDCEITGTTTEPFGAVTLMPEWQHLLGITEPVESAYEYHPSIAEQRVDWAFEQRVENTRGEEKLILLTLAMLDGEDFDDDGMSIYAIASQTRIVEKTALKALNGLIAQGLVERVGDQTVYRALCPVFKADGGRS